jgi:hypothetical protein
MEFNDRRDGTLKPLASDRAAYLQGTWMHGKPNVRAVVWTKPAEGQKKGVRYEGSHVSPSKDGVTLLGGPKAKKFTNADVDEVHYYENK